MKPFLQLAVLVTLLCFEVRGESVPALLSPKDLRGDGGREVFLETLKRRFKNNNFDEMIFPLHEEAAAPRVDAEQYRQMMDSFLAYLGANPAEESRLKEFPPLQPFYLGAHDSAVSLSPEVRAHAMLIPAKLAALQARLRDGKFLSQSGEDETKIRAEVTKTLNLRPNFQVGDLLKSERTAKALVQALSTQFMRGEKARASGDISDILVTFALGEDRLKKLREWNLPDHALLEVAEDALREGARLARVLFGRRPGH